MSDMRNVNNWHWVNKDCRPWAKKYFNEHIVGLSTFKENVNIKITSLDECTGDVDLNQRKGKLFAIYDLALKLSWEANDNKDRAFGNISIPEIAYDTEDYVFNCTVNQSTHFGEKAKSIIRSQLVPLLKEIFSRFNHDLINSCSSDLYANQSNKVPELQKKQEKQRFQPIESQVSNSITTTITINHSFEMKGAGAKYIYEALLDPKRASIWTRSNNLKVSKKIGSSFEFFDKNVQGVLLGLTPHKSIRQTWRLRSWPKGHYSTVTIDLLETKEGVTVSVNQVGVPAGQEDAIKRNWMGYYWKSIQDCYTHLQSMPLEEDIPSLLQYQKTLLYLLVELDPKRALSPRSDREMSGS
ncbi:hypothetical protein G6F43_005132 [Rhizopus delemar]|nr:hypothetical protein G6F43_005132 [Rhizopus delemar]